MEEWIELGDALAVRPGMGTMRSHYVELVKVYVKIIQGIKFYGVQPPKSTAILIPVRGDFEAFGKHYNAQVDGSWCTYSLNLPND